MQFIDARDLGAFCVSAMERGLTGIYNTIGRSISWQEWLDGCQAASGSDATYTWIDDAAFLMENIDMQAKMFGALPGVVPAEMANLWTIKSDRALAKGLTYRSPEETARDVLAWDKTRPSDEERVAGLDPEQEQALLEKWHTRTA